MTPTPTPDAAGSSDAEWLNDIAASLPAEEAQRLRAIAARIAAPIDMVLHCPACGKQHIDGPDDMRPNFYSKTWDNPPHRSHLCHGCGHVWRPADVPTNGVAAVKTKGQNDSPIANPPAPDAPELTDEELLSIYNGMTLQWKNGDLAEWAKVAVMRAAIAAYRQKGGA